MIATYPCKFFLWVELNFNSNNEVFELEEILIFSRLIPAIVAV